jgi:hypothetical protein
MRVKTHGRCEEILVVVLSSLLVFMVAISAAQAQPMSYEDVTRENTIEAYMTFIQANSDSDEAEEAYELMADIAAEELKVKSKVKKKGKKGCNISGWTQAYLTEKMIKHRLKRVPVFLCDAYVVTQTLKNTTPYYLIAISTSSNTLPTLAGPGKKLTVKRVVAGNCGGKVKLKRGKTPSLNYYPCSPPEIKLPKVTAMTEEMHAEFSLLLKKKSGIGAEAYRSKYPRTPESNWLKYEIKDWKEAEIARLKSLLKFKVTYTKKKSAKFANPYRLTVKNNGDTALKVKLVLEVEFSKKKKVPGPFAALYGRRNHKLTIPAKGEITVESETRAGAEPVYKIATVIPILVK